MWQNTFLDAAIKTATNVSGAQVLHDPFDHVVVPNVFPTPVYDLMIQHAIPDECLGTLSDLKRTKPGAYDARHMLTLGENIPRLDPTQRTLWQEVYRLIGHVVTPQLIKHFAPVIQARFGSRVPAMQTEVLYVRDRQGYALGPHTDHPRKIFTFIIYLAAPGITGPGTSFYRPRDPSFTCQGGPHYQHEHFDLVKTTPYLANTLLSFAKTNLSFHGVEKILDPVTRNLLICDVQLQ